MKKLLSLFLPGLIIFTFIWVDSTFPDSKYIILGIYLLFPLIFIVQGYIYSIFNRILLFGFLLSSIAIILPISSWYNMGSVFYPVIIYIVLGMLSFFLFRKYNRLE